MPDALLLKLLMDMSFVSCMNVPTAYMYINCRRTSFTLAKKASSWSCNNPAKKIKTMARCMKLYFCSEIDLSCP